MSVHDLPTTRWHLREENREAQYLLVRDLGISPIVSGIIINRDIGTTEEIRHYLSPSLHDLHNPFLMRDMKKAVERFITAFHQKKKIVVFGDYDADGITSVVVLLRFICEIHGNASFYIPDRMSEGYGLNIASVKRFHSEGVGLIVTVDCGMANHEEIALAKELGIDVIILDHHEPSESLPPADAIVNPKRSDCSFPFKQLAAVGIVFNFLIALRGALRTEGFWSNSNCPNLRGYLDLVALGTIGDVVPLVDENRIFAKIGMELISQDTRIGIRALKMVCGLEGKPIEASRASFTLIPRINAAGRISSAANAVELLLSENSEEAFILAQKLEGFNKKRQLLERAIFAQLLETVSKATTSGDNEPMVFSSPDWHPGVIGIVASKLADRFGRPAILISIKDGLGKGSGRSAADFNLFEGIKRCESHLLAYGGHRYAAGILIEEENIAPFTKQLSEIINDSCPEQEFASCTAIDAQCLLADINHELLTQIQMLAPFGSGNQEPILCARNVSVSSPAIVGNNHLKMRVSNNGISRDSIWFNKGQYLPIISQAVLDIVFTPKINDWNGAENIQLIMRDAIVKKN
ncbi:MAG: single-stranded-DNA-specific exonuclease RecJ [Syntrophales bacterium]|jgi:single-stranded-DNA-specific exonuclease|nr:single-stranded-DNA-specific exonuclease RecJ [Syntrophales bacterium]